MIVEAIKLKDIRDKEQMYVVIQQGNKKVIINVGKKTYEAVHELTFAQMVNNTATKDAKK